MALPTYWRSREKVLSDSTGDTLTFPRGSGVSLALPYSPALSPPTLYTPSSHHHVPASHVLISSAKCKVTGCAAVLKLNPAKKYVCVSIEGWSCPAGELRWYD